MLNINAIVTKKALSFDEKEERIKKEEKSPKKEEKHKSAEALLYGFIRYGKTLRFRIEHTKPQLKQNIQLR
jgi:hypothetical protein